MNYWILLLGTQSEHAITYSSLSHSNNSPTMFWKRKLVHRRSIVEAQLHMSSSDKSVATPQPSASLNMPTQESQPFYPTQESQAKEKNTYN